MNVLWRFLKHPIVLCIIGIIASYYFYEKGRSDVVAAAKEEGRAAGHAQGMKEANDAFAENLPHLIEQRYPGALGNAEDLGYQTGLTEGSEKGLAAGETTGEAKGRQAALAECALRRQAAQDWAKYKKAVDRLADLAQSLAERPGEKSFQDALLFETRAVVESARALQAAYTQKATAFNSIIEDLAAALSATNFPALRTHARALQSSLPIKEQLFLRADENVANAFDRLDSLGRQG